MKNLITDCLEIVPATYADFKLLQEYHYQERPPSMPDQIYKIRGNTESGDAFPDPVAVIIFSMPFVNLHGRTVATSGYFRKARTEIGRLRLVNQKIRYIARLIVDPRFHKQGLATWLLKDTLERQTIPIVETLTPIDFTNKIFQKAGFKLYNSPAPDWYKRFTDSLATVRVKLDTLSCPPAVHYRLQSLPARQKGFVEKEILLFIKHFRHRKGMKNSLDRTVFFCSKLPYPQAYLIWFNPRVPSYHEKPAKKPVTPTT